MSVKTVQDLITALCEYPPRAPVMGTWEGQVKPLFVYRSVDGVVMVDADFEFYRPEFEDGTKKGVAFLSQVGRRRAYGAVNIPHAIDVNPGSPWMPPGLVEPTKIRVRFSKAERDVWRRRRRIPASDWTERHITVVSGPYEGSRWRNEVTPYLTGIMDASMHASTREVYICASPQTGKSMAVNNCIGCASDQAPGPAMFCYPDELTAKENTRDRILPMYRRSPRLRGYLTGRDDDEGILRVNLKHMPIYLAWARSASRLANKSIRYVVGDEIDKYPETAGAREAGPIDLLRKRKIAYRYNYKLWLTSTPTVESGPIWVAITQEAEFVFEYWVRCPECHERVLMHFDRTEPRGGIRWPEGERDPRRIESQDLARYQCDHCGALWDDHQRDRAVKAGEWRTRLDSEAREAGERPKSLRTVLEKDRPHRIGFHLPSWISPFVGLSQVAADFRRSLHDKNKLKDFQNGHKAEPWIPYEQERPEEQILALRDDRPRGVVPGNNVVAALTAGVDTQDDGFWYEIRAWSWGPELTSWQVRQGFVEKVTYDREGLSIDGFQVLSKILWEDVYPDPDGKEYGVELALQDAMGHRTAEVYEYARLNRGRLFATQGSPRQRAPINYSNQEFYPGSKKPIPGGVQLCQFNTTFWKNKLASKLEIDRSDPGAWLYHAETDEDWARQMCSEVPDEKGVWVQLGNRPNHGWDCSVLNLVAAEILGIRNWSREAEPKQPAPPPPADGGWLPGMELPGEEWLS